MTTLPDPSADSAVAPLAFSDLSDALRAGLADFRAAPQFGLFFAAVYVIMGLALVRLGAGMLTWTLTMTLGFPLAAPFLAVGLYEVSRRRAQGARPRFAEVLGVVWAERNRQIPWIGALILIYVLFWSFLAHMLFALFMGPSAMMGPPESLSTYLTGDGLTMLATGTIVGAVLAFLLFALTAVSLPMLLDREVDFVTAMLASVRLVRDNLAVMALWAAIIAVLTLAALAPVFLGLFLVLPVLGHASWHLYCRAAGKGLLD
ncbi:hypothetical protein ROJ8625_01914 [Roseivivax jejudonensis]|uniref:DUF2189 domain-containing protein n=1 Tax=Roseivivax jejudonensis TaxID=1529041 RepID=A0A1X6Z587_9RHOB|nr:DUF2189 domain-containing protein [Roseivivax jejudonensis]SLN40553.1 hypothetical protein ROJ8625_01914 [Roseivivax jejudonensis]